jgi:uncharacterized membrane protein YgcG
MSTPLALARPLRSPETEQEPTRHLEIAPDRAQRRARPRLVYALIVVGGIGVILLAQLLLSISLADGAYRISALQVQQRDYSRQERALTEKLSVLGSTQNLTSRAEELGMVTSGSPVFLDAASGAVTGSPTPAGGSLIGSSGNLVGNSLLGGDGIDSSAEQAAQDAAAGQTPATEEDGGIATADGGTGSTGTGSTGTGSGSTGSTSTGGGSTGSTGGANVPSGRGVIPSPTTH